MHGFTAEKRARAASTALVAYAEAGGAYWGDCTDEKIADLVAGLRHLCDDYGFNWYVRLQEGTRIYECEKAAAGEKPEVH